MILPRVLSVKGNFVNDEYGIILLTLTGKPDGNVISGIREAARHIPEEVVVEYIEDEGEKANLRRTHERARELGAVLGVPLSREVIDGFTADELKKLFKQLSKNIADLTDPDMVSLDEMGDFIKRTLPPIVSVNLKDITRKRMEKLASDRAERYSLLPGIEKRLNRLHEGKQPHFVSIGAPSLGHAKALIDMHRERMRGRKAVKLQIRVSVSKEDSPFINEEREGEIRRMMGMASDVELIFVDKEDAKNMTISDIYNKYIAGLGLNLEDITIVDREKEAEKDEPALLDLLKEMTYIENEEVDYRITYDETLRIISRKPGKKEKLNWYTIFRMLPDIEAKEAQREALAFHRAMLKGARSI